MHTAALTRSTPITRPLRMLFSAVRGALLAIAIFAMIILLLLVWHIASTALDWSEIRDFVAPTAAQARDGGWMTLSEGAAP